MWRHLVVTSFYLCDFRLYAHIDDFLVISLVIFRLVSTFRHVYARFLLVFSSGIVASMHFTAAVLSHDAHDIADCAEMRISCIVHSTPPHLYIRTLFSRFNSFSSSIFFLFGEDMYVVVVLFRPLFLPPHRNPSIQDGGFGVGCVSRASGHLFRAAFVIR